MAIPGDALRVTHPASAAIIPWYLSGGISAANCIAAYQPKGAADYAASKVNLANPGTYNAADGAAYPTWDATSGWIFNGSTQYLDSGFVPNKIHSIIVRFSNGGTDQNRQIAGAETNTTNYPRYSFTPRNIGSSAAEFVFGNSKITHAGVIAAGVLAITPAKVYVDGTGEGSFAAWGALANQTSNLFIGARGIAGVASLHKVCYVQAFAIYNITLSDAQALALSTAMAAL